MHTNKAFTTTYRNIALIVFLVIISIPVLYFVNKKHADDSAQNSCMKLLEQAATDARNETSEKHAQIMFAAMAKPECKEMNKPKT